MDKVSVRTLGTGAADHNWKKIGSPSVRGSCTTLIDNRILVDYGTTGKENLSRFDIAPDALEYLFITHYHSDHCVPEKIAELIAARKNRKKLAVIADIEVLNDLSRLCRNFTAYPAESGSHFKFKGFEVTAASANHSVSKGTALHYLFEISGKLLFYALDGAWMTTQERRMIGSCRLDMILWDATIGTEGDYRIFEHNDLNMLKQMYTVLSNDGVVDSNTVILLDHLAKTLWPGRQSDCRKMIPRNWDNWKIASDGAEYFL